MQNQFVSIQGHQKFFSLDILAFSGPKLLYRLVDRHWGPGLKITLKLCRLKQDSINARGTVPSKIMCGCIKAEVAKIDYCKLLKSGTT